MKKKQRVISKDAGKAFGNNTQHQFTSKKHFTTLGIKRCIQIGQIFCRWKEYRNIGKEDRE